MSVGRLQSEEPHDEDVSTRAARFGLTPRGRVLLRELEADMKREPDEIIDAATLAERYGISR